MTQVGQKLRTHRNHLTPYCPQKLLIFPPIHFFEQNLEIFLDSDTTDMIQNDFYTSYDNSEFDAIVFSDDAICNDDDDKSLLFEK